MIYINNYCFVQIQLCIYLTFMLEMVDQIYLMKYIFRYALLTNYTNKQQQISPEQLNQALKVAKFNLSGRNLEQLIEQSNQCVQSLLKNSDKKSLQSLISDAYPKSNISQAQVSDILSIWQSQKHLVFKKMIGENTKSGKSYAGLSWSVRNSISARYGKINNSKSVHVRVRDSEGQMEINFNKAQFQKLSQRLNSAQAFLSELFTSG